MEIFKILKFQEPSAIQSLSKFSRCGISKGLITPSPSKLQSHFIYKSAFICNYYLRLKLMLDQYDMSFSLSQTKNHQKTVLLQNHDKTNWHPYHEIIAKIECS